MSEFGDIRSKLEDYEKITKGLRGIYSEAPVAIATANSEGMFIEGNKTTLNLYGLKDISELQLHSIFNDPSLLEKDKKELRNGKSIQYSSTFDFDKLRREGIMKTSRSGIGHYQIFISPFFLREIGQSGYLSIIVDVTERKNIEDKLRESEEIYRKLVETSPDAITVTDLNGHIVTISQQTLKIHGFKNEEEVLGKSAMILIASESHQKAIDNMARTFEEGSIRNEEYSFIRKDGTTFPAELNASVITDVNDNPTHLIAVTRDITKQKEVEQTLRENEEKLRLLFDNANDSIFLVKLDKKGRIGKFVEVNEATIKWTGYSKEELLEMTPTQLMSEEVIADVKNVIKHILEHGFLTFESEIILKDGKRMPVEFSSSLFILNEELYILSTAREIEERVEARKIREKEMQEKTLLLDIITHDLRNYLAPVWSCISEAIENDEFQIKNLHDAVISAKASLAKTDALIDNISVLMKKDIDFSYDLISTNILDSIEMCESSLNEIFPMKEIIFNLEGINPAHNFLADSLFEQMLLNILTNSVKNDSSNEVKIDIKSKELEEDKIILTIADYGEGISPKDRENIFERYGEFRKKGKGSGLGLFIIQTLVQRYNGKVWIENRVKNDYTKGTIFNLELNKVIE